MSSKKNLVKNAVDGRAPEYSAEHLVVAVAVIIAAAASAATMGYHVWTDAKMEFPFRLAAALFAVVVTFSVSMVPLALAKPHGQSIEGGGAQNGLMLVVIGLMFVDGFFEAHAIGHVMYLMGMNPLSLWFLVPIVGAYQLSTFFARGSLVASTTEQQEYLDAMEQHRATVEARVKIETLKAETEAAEREERNARRREKYAEKKATVAVDSDTAKRDANNARRRKRYAEKKAAASAAASNVAQLRP